MDQLQKDINELVKFDPLSEAEDITGHSYKENDAVTLLGMALMMGNNERKTSALKFTNDAYFNQPVPEYIETIKRIGFEQIGRKNFSGESCGTIHHNEQFFFWLPSKGILLEFDTYSEGGGINSGSFYYNLRLDGRADGKYGWQSSGGLSRIDNGVWIGNHDAREAVRHHIGVMETVGTFLPKWIERSWLWLLNWSDTKATGYDHAAITEANIAMFPKEVRRAITP